jgi:hypothetical protein
MTKFEKWQMDLVIAADMAESGLTEEEVVQQFAALGALEIQHDLQQELNQQEKEEQKQGRLRTEVDTWTDENWLSMMEAFQVALFKETVLIPKQIVDSPLEKVYLRFVNAAEQLCEELVGVGSNRKEWDRPLSFVEGIVNVLRSSHDSGHLRDSAATFDKSLISVADVCRTGFDNLADQGTVFSDLLSLTANAAAALRGELLLAV